MWQPPKPSISGARISHLCGYIFSLWREIHAETSERSLTNLQHYLVNRMTDKTDSIKIVIVFHNV